MKKRTAIIVGIIGIMLVQTGCMRLQQASSGINLKETQPQTAPATENIPVIEVQTDPLTECSPETEKAFEFEESVPVYEEAMAAYDMDAVSAQAMGSFNGFAEEECWIAPEPDWNTEEYSYTPENGWKSVKASPFSTFAADVDTASYANLRRMILRGEEIPADAVRIEEMINYFHYDYPQPEDGKPFSVTTELAPCPWNDETSLLLVGLQAETPETDSLPPSNLVFLIDVSGSMDEPDKLPLVQRAFHLLTEQLDEEDRISVVTYASEDRVVLDGTNGNETAVIDGAIEDLMAGGGTNGSAGIVTAYELAKKHFIKDGNNRVILATDGDLNIGVTDEGSLTRLIQEQAESGVYLSVLGFGTGNISDTNMEALADHGNGNYSYIDEIAEARKVLIREMGGTLHSVADDVKLQVEFNPDKVKGYRLIGYENRTMAAEDFADDTKDGGEIGAGHRVTALYEIAPVGSGQEVSEVESRYSGNKNAAEAVQEQNTEDVETARVPEEEQTDSEEPEKTQTDTDRTEGSGEKAAYDSDPETEWLTVNVRYKDPGQEQSRLIVCPVSEDLLEQTMSDNMSWAAGVAQTGMLLKNSEYAGTSSWETVRERLGSLPDAAKDDLKVEFLYLLGKLASRE